MQFARRLIAADPTLICPDPADHELAAAVRRLPDYWYIERYDGVWHVLNDVSGEPPCRAHAPTLEAAITAALGDKP